MARKGSLTIQIAGTDWPTGAQIDGQVALRTKKQVQSSRTWVALVCEADDGTDAEGAREWQAWHRDEVVLAGDQVHPPGHETTLPFRLTIPPPPPPPPLPDPGSGRISRFRQTRAIKSHQKLRRRYRIEARVVAKGFDLTDTVKLVVDGQKYRNVL